ncbi:hypothetical protein QIS99_16035 [Streptomyces sp. B-S-A8]|uniref:Uncharacterized protein n=1 Tax=Streptomyces solicavernae TaxID=3043614 RepID=A0ABT6RTH3_9ACTN|nr:hypothetical protein [Streptomyces sp. B-S-A8]MDI3387697.1 hypothetical protein [Streptomyces sp. B-S-A8]
MNSFTPSTRHRSPPNVLQLTVVLLGPSMSLYAADIALRRNRYDGPALTDESRHSPFWYDGGVNWAGACALTGGVTASALSVNTLCTGPIAAAPNGVDLALPAGLVVSPLLYLLLMHTRLAGPTHVRGL